MCITVSKGLIVKVTWAGTEESGKTRREATWRRNAEGRGNGKCKFPRSEVSLPAPESARGPAINRRLVRIRVIGTEGRKIVDAKSYRT